MRSLLHAVVGLCLGWGWYQPVLAASLLIHKLGKSADIVVLGQINSGDQYRFRQSVVQLIKEGYWISLVYVFSPGGDVEAAIDIGEQLHVLRASTVAPQTMDRPAGVRMCFANALPGAMIQFNPRTARGNPSCDCASACVLIWAAGFGRQGNTLGVHRPHFADSSFAGLSPVQAEVKYNQMRLVVEKYLKRMDFPDELTRVMFATSSKDIRYLTKTEISQFEESSAALQELVIARCGVKQALNSSENSSVRERNFKCIQALYEEVSRGGGKEYLKVYDLLKGEVE